MCNLYKFNIKNTGTFSPTLFNWRFDATVLATEHVSQFNVVLSLSFTKLIISSSLLAGDDKLIGQCESGIGVEQFLQVY